MAAARAQTMLDEELPAYVLDGERGATLTPDRMTISYTGGDSDPRKLPFGDRMRAYALDDGKATAIPWTAFDAEDFTEQWLLAPWDRGVAVSRPAEPGLEAWHEKLRPIVTGGNASALAWSSVANAGRCRNDPAFWQYGIIFGRPKPGVDLTANDDEEVCTVPGSPRQECLITEARSQFARLEADFIDPHVVYFLVREISPNSFQMAGVSQRPRLDCAE